MAQRPFPNVGSAAITGFTQLVERLQQAGCARDHSRLMASFLPSDEELLKLARFDPRHYMRVHVHGEAAFELLLICYEPYQRTSIHDYDSQQAWIKPVMGVLEEERFERTGNGLVRRTEVQRLDTYTLSQMGEGDPIHRHGNPGPGRTITVNLYVRPITRWHVYDGRTDAARLQGPSANASE